MWLLPVEGQGLKLTMTHESGCSMDDMVHPIYRTDATRGEPYPLRMGAV